MWANASIFVTFPLRGSTADAAMPGSYGSKRSSVKALAELECSAKTSGFGCQLVAEVANPCRFVDELRWLDADRREPPGQLGGDRCERLVQVGDLVGSGEDAASAADVLDLGGAAPGRDQPRCQPGQRRVVGLTERVEAAAVFDQPVDEAPVHR